MTDNAPASPPESTYGAQDITVLEGLEAVRKRPGMYIGSTGPRGLHHLIYEVVDNAVDEALAGECDLVEIALAEWLELTVWRDGHEWRQRYERGVPTGPLVKGERTDRRGTRISYLP